MKLIAKETDYAIAALSQLALHEGTLQSASALARELGISHAFLRQILSVLAGREIVKSRNGSGGGFALRKDPRQITVCDIVEIFQGPVQVSDCAVGGDMCERANRCVLRGKFKTMESRLVSDLMGITIASLVEEQGALARTGRRRR